MDAVGSHGGARSKQASGRSKSDMIFDPLEVPFGSVSVPLGSLLAPLWCPWLPLGSLWHAGTLLTCPFVVGALSALGVDVVGRHGGARGHKPKSDIVPARIGHDFQSPGGSHWLLLGPFGFPCGSLACGTFGFL